MNIQANITATLLDDAPLSIADQIRLKIVSISCELAGAMLDAEAVTLTRHWPLQKAKDHLNFARNLYRQAVRLGATTEQLSRCAADGHTAAAAVASAEARVSEGLALRAEKQAAKEAERLRKARGVRAKLMGSRNTREAARFVAAQLVERGVVAEEVEGIRALVAAVAPKAPTDCSPDEILAAWMQLDPP